jgi:TPR repeat protein
VRWAREAAANGLPNAESNVAFIILSFPSEGKETELALSTVEKEIEAGNLDVMFNEAVRTWSHSPLVPVPGFGRANERAYRLMKTAAEKGYLPARNFLGIPNK